MDYKNFQRILAFFSALNDSGFKKTLKDISSFTTIGGQRTPVDKAKSMELLRLLPDFQGDEFKDDNNIVKYLSDPRNRDRIWGKFSREQQKELTKTLNEKPLAKEGVVYQQGGEEAPVEQTPTEGTSGGSGGGIPNIGIPSAPSISSPRFIHNVPHAPETPKPEIAIANKGGVVAEKPPTEFHVTDKAGNIQATYSKEPVPAAPQSKLVTTGSGPGNPSKLVTTQGGVIKEAPPKQIFIANKSGVTTRLHNIKSPGWLKSFGSNAQIFAKRNLGRIADGLTHSVLPSGANFLGKTGLKAFNHGGNFLSNLSSSKARLAGNLNRVKSRASSVGEVKKLSLGLGILFMIVFVSALGDAISDTSTGEAAPISTTTPSYQPGEGKGIISCPLKNGEIILGSQGTPGGHCSPEYQKDYPCSDQDITGKGTAVDLQNRDRNDRAMYMPMLNNGMVNWNIEKVDTNTNYTDANGRIIEGGYSLQASASSEGKTYLIRFVHMDEPTVKSGFVSSNYPIGTYRATDDHIHVTIKENGEFRPADLYFNLCQLEKI